MRRYLFAFAGAACFAILLGMLACGTQKKPSETEGLRWAEGIVWYQIFPERFYNGLRANDPQPEEVPEAAGNPEWRIHPWTADWYKFQPWEKKVSADFYDGKVVFARRFGGDLIGVIQKLDYLKELGIDAIYFNPIFEAPSLHKYDGSTYHHVDDNFGPAPERDRKRLAEAKETDDPATWIWTSADSVFLMLLREAHRRGIRVVIDGVFNHTGTQFFAFRDILKNGPSSPYAHWYAITRWDDPTTPENEFDYKGWWGIKSLPELAEDENGIVHGPREYIFAATRRWMDPNNDGDPSDGVDGWRLDVAQEVAPAFWKEWYALVKSINPSAITVAEIWEDASEWIRDRRMDATMNYLFAKAVVSFFIDRKKAISAEEFARRLNEMIQRYGQKVVLRLWNLVDSHDTDRLASMIVNPDRDYDCDNSPRWNPDYDVRKPTAREREIQKQIVAFQMTFPGAPVIYYGDEAGMWGADDPDDRKPMVWPEFEYEPERSHPLPGKTRPPDLNRFDDELFRYYKKWIAIRHRYAVLKYGNFQVLDQLTEGDLFVFERKFSGQRFIGIFNRSAKEMRINLRKILLKRRALNLWTGETVSDDRENSLIRIGPRGFLALLEE